MQPLALGRLNDAGLLLSILYVKAKRCQNAAAEAKPNPRPSGRVWLVQGLLSSYHMVTATIGGQNAQMQKREEQRHDPARHGNRS